MESWREVWFEKTLPVEGRIEYVEGRAEVIDMEGGGIVLPKSRRVGVAVWIGGGYMLWFWDGTKWFAMKDKRLEEKGVDSRMMKGWIEDGVEI